MADRHPTIAPEDGTRASSLEARDPFAEGLFPICVESHDTGLRFLFDLGTLLLLLDCRPGDRVLDIGAGSGFSSEMLARFGYDVVAVDPDGIALGHNRRRPHFDRSRIDGTVRVVQGVAERLPFEAASFDGLLGMNVMHHVPDLPAAVSELARVLRPGCRAVFSEPGLEHLGEAHTRRAMREHGESDRNFDVVEFLRLARARGFADAMLSATLHPPLRLVPLEEIELFASGQHPRSFLTPQGVFDVLHRWHPYAMLVHDGVRPKTSRHPGVLQCDLVVEGLPGRARAGESLHATVRVRNTGDTIWLSRPSPLGGYVNIGCKLLTTDGRLITDRPGRTGLSGDIAPGELAIVPVVIEVPDDLPPGPYGLQIDLVDELICWFSDVSVAASSSHAIQIEEHT